MIRYTHNYLKYSFWCKPEYEEVLDGNILNSEVLIVGLTWCPWTIRAKNLIEEQYGIEPKILTPDMISNKYKINLLYCLCKKVNTIYVPQIWIKGDHIGNFEHLYKMHHRKQINL